MSTERLSQSTGQTTAFDPQQALLLAILRRAEGRPVSYQELHDAGIEYPASVVSELELAGLALERCHRSDAARHSLCVRLELHGARIDAALGDSDERQPGALARILRASASIEFSFVAPAAAHGRQALGRLGDRTSAAARAGRRATSAALSRRHARRAQARRIIDQVLDALRSGGWRGSMRAALGRARTPRWPGWQAGPRWLAPAALLAAAAALGAMAAGALTGTGRVGRVRPRPAAQSRAASAREPHARSSLPGQSRARPAPWQQAGPVPATPVSATLATQLEARGHDLLEAGQLGVAVPVLRRALVATGESLAGCHEPVSETCLTYAYALYDLGRALRLDRRAAAAVPILENRLQIANQRPTVLSQLELARQEAGHPAPIPAATG